MACEWCGHGHCPYCGRGYCHFCGRGHCHHCGNAYGPAGPWPGYAPGYGPPRRWRHRLEEEDLASYLEQLEEEIGQVREELAGLRRSRQAAAG